MPISKSRNFDIEVLYFDFDIGPDIELRYRSSLTSIYIGYRSSMKSDTFIDFNFEALRYRVYFDLLRYGDLTSILKCFDIEDNFDIEAEHHIWISRFCTLISKFL